MKHLGLWGIIVVTIAYTIFFSWFTIGRHWKINSTRFDLGNAEQVIWNGAHGRWFQATDPYGSTTVSRLAYHADYFLMLLVPIYAALPFTETLLVLQTLALASAVLAVYGLAKHWLRHEGWAFFLAAGFALQPALHWMNLYDFHAVAFATPLILWAALALVKQRYGWMMIVTGLAMLTKEEIGFVFIPLALYLWIFQKQRGWGIAMLLPALWAGGAMFILIPSAQSVGIDATDVFHSPLGNSAAEILRNALLHPRQVWSLATADQTLHYAKQVLLPFGWFPFGHWLAAIALPDVVINVLSGKASQQTIYFQYMASIVSGLMLGWLAMLRWMQQHFSRRLVLPLAVTWMVGWASIGTFLYGPLPGARMDHTRVVRWRNDYAAPVRSWATQISTSASVSVTNNIGAQFARRAHLYSFPLGLDQADFAVILQGHQDPEVVDQRAVDAAVVLLQGDPAWTLRFHQDDFWVFERAA